MSPVKVGGRLYDYAAECFDCRNEFRMFNTKADRDVWRKEHEGHNIDLYLQGRV